MTTPTSRQRLLEVCKMVPFEGMPLSLVSLYENFPHTVDVKLLTDEAVLAIQEYTMSLLKIYGMANLKQVMYVLKLYGSVVLYEWWKHNVRDAVHEFTEKEIEV